MSNISNIDDLLMGVGNSQQPATPEHKDKLEQEPEPKEKAPIEEDTDTPTYDDTDESDSGSDDSGDNTDESEPDTDDEDEKPDSKSDADSGADSDEEDEYGNKKERMSKGMKDRLDRKEKQHQREIEQREREIQALRQQLSNQGASTQVQKAAADFKYDPNDEASWQQQLTDFVKHTVKNMHNEDQEKERDMREQHAERQFHEKFQQGMERFSDFREVVGKLPMHNDMTKALRGMADPTAFIYAAAKRQPGEIERISKLSDPYARMVEMGKLEERMRRNKPTTKAPRPLGKVREDATSKVTPKQKDMTGDDLLAKADAKRLATVRNRHKANR
jgi:hypothetical protein